MVFLNHKNISDKISIHRHTVVLSIIALLLKGTYYITKEVQQRANAQEILQFLTFFFNPETALLI